MGECTQSKGGGPRHFRYLAERGRSRAAHIAAAIARRTAESGSATVTTPRMWRLLFSAQSPDERIGSKFGLGVRVVAAMAARAVALLAGAHVIVGAMMTPEARCEHGLIA